MKLFLHNVWDKGSDDKLRRVFSWLTRIGAGHKFGSLPIGWYQAHQCHCINILREAVGNAPTAFRCKHGNIQWQACSGSKWRTLMSATDLFQKADNKCRV